MSKKSSKKPKSSSVPPAPKPKQTSETPAAQPAAPVSRVGSSSTKSLKERKDERDKQQRRNQQVTIAAVVGVVVLVLVLLFISANQPAAAPVEVANNYDNIPAYSDPVTGFPRLGNPDAPVTLIEYSSFGCPGCKDFHDTVFPALMPRIRAGEVAFIFLPQFTGAGQVESAARAALCVADQDQTKFWQVHDIFFNWQGLYATSAFNQNRITSGLEALDVNMGAFNACFNSASTNNLIDKARQDGVASTPTVKINGSIQPDMSVAALNAVIDSAVAAARTADPTLELPVYPEVATDVIATEEVVVTEEAVATEEVVETEAAVTTEEAAETEAADATSEPTAEATSED